MVKPTVELSRRTFVLNTLDVIAGMDHDAYEHYIEDLCMNKTRLFETVLKISPELMDAVQVSMSNPFKKQLGQLTVYRVRLHFRKEQCKTTDSAQCSAMKENDRLLPYHQQLWPAYMGIRGDCRANLGWSITACTLPLNPMWYSFNLLPNKIIRNTSLRFSSR